MLLYIEKFKLWIFGNEFPIGIKGQLWKPSQYRAGIYGHEACVFPEQFDISWTVLRH